VVGELAKGLEGEIEVGRMVEPEPLMGEPMPIDWEEPPHED